MAEQAMSLPIRDSRPALPGPFTTSDTSLTLITQGAEALLYQTTFFSTSTQCALKYRPPKPYRHSILDKRLTRQRILAEARVLVRCKKDGVNVPGVLGLDLDAGWLACEWVPGQVVRAALQELRKRRDVADHDEHLTALLGRIGIAVGGLHAIGVVHGDLTTSNMMLRPTDGRASSLQGEIVLIDFGLAQQISQEEDRAVDLYVLERAFGSTHPEMEHLFQHVLTAYAHSYPGAKAVVRRLDNVRKRGRKKSMIG